MAIEIISFCGTFFKAQSIPLLRNPILFIHPLFSNEYLSVFNICLKSPSLGSFVKLPCILVVKGKFI